MALEIHMPLTEETVASLEAGMEVAITGSVYTARDVAHRRLVELIETGEKLPIELENQTIFYAGPTPVPPGRICGVVGPTTSKRMDAFTPILLEAGVRGMIGKGPRAPEVISAIQRFKAVYFAATGGAAALLSTFIAGCEIAAWPELGPEAIWRFDLKGFPAFVAIDSRGNDLYAEGLKKYAVGR